MENIDRLLEKYFQAATSLAEESILKNYFTGNDVLPEHEQFRCLFVAFNAEHKEVSPHKVIIQCAKSSKTNKYFVQGLITTAIAACLLIAIWVIKPTVAVENYAVAKLETNVDSDFAQKYVEEKLNEVSAVVTKNMKPIQTLSLVKKRLRPIRELKSENANSDKQQETTNSTKTTTK